MSAGQELTPAAGTPTFISQAGISVSPVSHGWLLFLLSGIGVRSRYPFAQLLVPRIAATLSTVWVMPSGVRIRSCTRSSNFLPVTSSATMPIRL